MSFFFTSLSFVCLCLMFEQIQKGQYKSLTYFCAVSVISNILALFFMNPTTPLVAKPIPPTPNPVLEEMSRSLDASNDSADRILLMLADIKADLCHLSPPLEASLEASLEAPLEAEESTPKDD